MAKNLSYVKLKCLPVTALANCCSLNSEVAALCLDSLACQPAALRQVPDLLILDILKEIIFQTIVKNQTIN